jgi:hypothetical protein
MQRFPAQSWRACREGWTLAIWSPRRSTSAAPTATPSGLPRSHHTACASRTRKFPHAAPIASTTAGPARSRPDHPAPGAEESCAACIAHHDPNAASPQAIHDQRRSADRTVHYHIREQFAHHQLGIVRIGTPTLLSTSAGAPSSTSPPAPAKSATSPAPPSSSPISSTATSHEIR